ncbi:type II toxin-antitoxin system VapC family toxin, partial [Deltaproteobacteria bacterium PRO3]|nr:type II toxin-antitoxin system VapC family toxin [Deltaproteobacteria bacterium PRO3]
MKCLLDTATFLWMIFGEEARLSKRALRIVQESEEIHLSAVSVWEIVIKYGIGKLSLKAHPKTWLPEIVLEMGLKSLPISQRHVLEVAELKD